MRRLFTRMRRRASTPGALLAVLLAGSSGVAHPLSEETDRGFQSGLRTSPESQASAPSRGMIDDLILDAAHRFGLPPHWIRAVMRQESGFNSRAVSHAGAMGLMQVMPATYAELRRRYDLGPDAFDPRDNIMAGAAYLRELHDRFGLEGMLAAYNAGPGRYLQHRDEGRRLPAETRDYMARIGVLEGRPAPSSAKPRVAEHPDPALAPLFPFSRDRDAREADLFVSPPASEAKPQ